MSMTGPLEAARQQFITLQLRSVQSGYVKSTHTHITFALFFVLQEHEDCLRLLIKAKGKVNW